jgi:CheY-like chemotaxis protein
LNLAPRTASGTEPGHILIVDDDEDVLLLCRLMLEPLGFTVAEALRSRDLISVARERRPSVILLDMFMPEFDGWDCMKALKADPELSDVPVVMISASDRGAAWSEEPTGVRGYLPKPFGAADLFDAVKDYGESPTCRDPHLPRLVSVEHSPW